MLTSIGRKETFLTTLLTATVVVLAYELRVDSAWLAAVPPWIVVVVAFLVSSFGGRWVFNSVMRTSLGRRILMGPTWLEGYWLLRTDVKDAKGSPVTEPGIAYLEYGDGDLSIHVRSYRPQLTPQGGIDTSFSATDFAVVDERTLTFYNHFTIPSADRPGRTRGVFVGKIINDGTKTYPTKVEGEVLFFDDMTYGHQLATKLSAKEIKSAKKQSPDEWQNVIINSYKSNKQPVKVSQP